MRSRFDARVSIRGAGGLAFLIACAACTGDLGDAAPPGSERGLTCEGAAPGLANFEQRRLSRRELLASLASAFGPALLAEPSVRAALGYLPQDTPFTVENGFDNRITDVEGLLAVAEAIARIVVTTPAHASAVLDCDPGVDAARCRDQVVDVLAPKLFRRPIEASERDLFRSFADDIGGADGVEWAIVRLVVSPQLQLQLELAGRATENENVRLASHEVATRLAFRLTGAPPDDELWRAVEDGELETVEDARLQAARLLETPAARAQLRAALSGWLGITSVADPDAILASRAAIDPVGLGDAATEELARFVDDVVFERDGTFVDLLTDKTVFPATDGLAALYGVARTDGASTITDARGGILFRAATLMTSSRATHPVSRGAFLRRKILCQALPTPDPQVVSSRDDEKKDLAPEKYSNRAIVEQLTRGDCQGCHRLIDPLGFALEGFGPMGELRQRELVFDAAGDVVAEHPIDTASDDVFVGDDVTPVSGAGDVAAVIAGSRDAAACFATQIFAQTRSRAPAPDDACTVADVESAVAERATIREVLLRNVVGDELFHRAPFAGEDTP